MQRVSLLFILIAISLQIEIKVRQTSLKLEDKKSISSQTSTMQLSTESSVINFTEEISSLKSELDSKINGNESSLSYKSFYHSTIVGNPLQTSLKKVLIGRILQSFGRSRNNNNMFGNNNDEDDLFGMNDDDDDDLFGNNNNNNDDDLFGNNNNNNDDDDDLFGNNNNNDDDLFGNNNNNNDDDLFGNNNNDDDMFGNNNNDDDLFGNNNNNNDDDLFGNNNNNNDDDLFGNNNNNNDDDLFGNNNNNNDDDLFGNNNNNNDDDDDLFGNNNNNNDDDLFGNNNNNNDDDLFGDNNNNNGDDDLFGNGNNNSNANDLFGGNDNNASRTGMGLGGSSFSQGNNQFKIKMPTININNGGRSEKSNDMKSELCKILKKMKRLEKKVNLALNKDTHPMSPFERDLGFLSLQKMGLLSPSDSNTKLIYFNSQKRKNHMKKALYDYIFQIASKKRKPRFLSFSLDMDRNRHGFFNKLRPRKKYYGNKFVRAFKTMGVESLQELPQNQYRNASISPLNLNRLLAQFSNGMHQPEPYPSMNSNSNIRRMFDDLDSILDDGSNISNLSFGNYFVGAAK